MVAARANANLEDRRSGGGRSVLFAQRLEAAAGLLNRRCCAFGRDFHFKSRLGCQFTHAKNLDSVASARDDAGLHEALDRDRLGRVELTGVDRLLNASEVDHIVIEPRGRGEAALRQTTMERHLATFEALDTDTGASRLPFAATARLLALA